MNNSIRRNLMSVSSNTGLAKGTVFDFNYTGTVQSVELPKGKYKLQCWGAQGGNVTGTYAVKGSKGGYSEGVLTLTEPTTLYIFVGGQGTSYTSSASQKDTKALNGGWNGGGAGLRTTNPGSLNNNKSFPRPGGGATDIATITSEVAYSNYRTVRDQASLLSRFIVAGGGAGASSANEGVFTEGELLYQVTTPTERMKWDPSVVYYIKESGYSSIDPYIDIKQFETETSTSSSTSSVYLPKSITIFSNYPYVEIVSKTTQNYDLNIYRATQTDSVILGTTNQQGGGVKGLGLWPGTQTSGGLGKTDGEFGYGASQVYASDYFASGGGGAGWYGGGANSIDKSTKYINFTGGGSGFVNTQDNASSRPSGYTGLQLDSGTTVAGNTSFESPTGGTETGHSGNGYARITVI